MTEPTTPAGRALLAWDNDEPDAGAQCESLWGPHWELHAAILAIENEARTEGRREAADAIRSEFVINEHPCHECDNGPMLHAILDHLDAVARHGRSSDPEQYIPPDLAERWGMCAACTHSPGNHGGVNLRTPGKPCYVRDCKCPGYRAFRDGRSSDPEPAPDNGNVAACEDCGFTSPHAVARCGVPTADARWEAWPADAALQATGEPSARLGSQEGSE